MAYLNREEIRSLILEKGLISKYIDLETQLQPNGFDLTVKQIYKTDGSPRMGFSNESRQLPNYIPMTPINLNYFNKWSKTPKKGWKLYEGAYIVAFNEVISLSLNLCARSQNRSSVMRCGCSTASGFWESGYSGSGYTLLNVGITGLLLEENARLCQIHFIRINPVEKGYSGEYQNENEGD